MHEDPRTHTFALLALPNRFVDGDKLPITGVDRWFPSRGGGAALADLLNREERDPAVELDDLPGLDDSQPS